MNHFISGIIKIILLEAQVCLLLFDAVVKDRFEKQKRWAFIALSALMVFAWSNYGSGFTSGRLIHYHEQFHFYLAAKYQAEVGWFDLYRAAVLADAETVHVISTQQIRNNETFELEPVSVAFEQKDRIVARFGPQRWEEFKTDWMRMTSSTRMDWNGIVQDHGNSNSPAWSLIAHPIASVVPLTPDGQAFLGWLDMILMGVMWWFIFKTFGWKVSCIALLAWAMEPLVFPYLAGSFLRWDWLFCLGMTVVMMKREKWLYAGLFFGFAVATKLFPLWFGVALGFRAAITMWRDKKLHLKYRQFAVGTIATGLGAVLLSAAMFGGFWAWSEYKRRIDAAVVERFYNIQYSLRTVYLQWRVSAGCAVSDCRSESYECSPAVCKGCCDAAFKRSPDNLWDTWLFPADMKQARTDVNVEDFAFGFRIAQLLFTVLVLLLVFRTDEIGAFCLGPLLVFTWLIVNMYYWNMLGLLALGLARRDDQRPALGALMGLHVIFMGYYLHVHTNHGMSDGYMVALQLCIWLFAFVFFEYRALKAEMTNLIGMLYGRKRA